MKRTVIALALGFGLTTAAFADNNDVFADPYWQQALNRSGQQTAQQQFAAGPRVSLSDATSEARDHDIDIGSIEAQKAQLDRAGFPQYVQ